MLRQAEENPITSSNRFAFVAPDYIHRADIAGTILLNPSKRENIHYSSLHVRNPDRSARPIKPVASKCLDACIGSAVRPATPKAQQRSAVRKIVFHLFLLRKEVENHACCLLVQSARKSAQFSPDETLATTRETYSAEIAAHSEAPPESGASGSEACPFLTVSTSSLQR